MVTLNKVLILNKERALIFTYNSSYKIKDKFSYLLVFGLFNKRLFSYKCGIGNNTNIISHGVVSQLSYTIFSISSISKLGACL